MAQKYVVENARLRERGSVLGELLKASGLEPGRGLHAPMHTKQVAASVVTRRNPRGNSPVARDGAEAAKPTFASIAARVRLPKSPPVVSRAGASAQVRGGPAVVKAVVIKAATDVCSARTGEETRAQVTQISELRLARLRGNRVSTIRHGVVCELKDEESRQKLLASSGLKAADLTATSQEPRRPDLKAYDVSKGMSDTNWSGTLLS